MFTPSILLKLRGLLYAAALLALLLCLGSCAASRPAWRGFHGPAYLPARAKVIELPTEWPANLCQQRPFFPRS